MGAVFQQVIVLLSWFMYSEVLSERLDKDIQLEIPRAGPSNGGILFNY